MNAIPQASENAWPCSAMYHEDEETGVMSLMFERELTAKERHDVRSGIFGNSHWADNQVLIIISLATD